MFKNNKLTKSIKLALVLGGLSTSAIAADADTQKKESVERIQVTGSSITRTDMEGALPITTITSADIAKTGVNSVADLMATIPSMQGFSTASDSVSGGDSAGGVQSASLRGIGEQYTLVLLNGRRLASADSGGTIDLNGIPLSAIKRVEVLTDGASALYGSDAIAGVVNFILKDDVQETSLNLRLNKPQDTGGESFNFSISTGFGDLSSDGYNIMLAYNHDQQERMAAEDRDFADSGFINFKHNGTEYTSILGSPNAGPANADVELLSGSTIRLNPYRINNNDTCAIDNVPEGDYCLYDYPSKIEMLPETTRDNFIVQGIFEINDSTELYSSATWSSFKMSASIAPAATNPFTLDTNSALVIENVFPHLTADQIADIDRVRARWRGTPETKRSTDWETETLNFTTGLRGEIADVSYDVALTYADSTRDENRIDGYILKDEFFQLMNSSQVNIFKDFADFTDTENQLIKGTMYNGPWTSTDTSLFSIEAQGSTVVAELPAGDMYLGFGADYREQEYALSSSDANKEWLILGPPTGGAEFDFARETYGVFLEAIIPVVEGLEVTTAVRYDNIGAITDSLVSDENGSTTDINGNAYPDKVVNEDVDDVTYKISAAYRPNDEWLIRASFGTGFKSATLEQIASPRVADSTTSGSYICPANLRAELASLCEPNPTQYSDVTQGNVFLEPETSEQFSAGFVYAPSSDFSLSIDYWSIDLENQISSVSEAQIFSDGQLYADLYTSTVEDGTNVLTIINAPVNIGKTETSGIDYALKLVNELEFGTLRTSLTGTYMIENRRLRAGETDVWDTSLGQFGTDDAVTFRNIINLQNTLVTGDLSHTLNINYKSGYRDIEVGGSQVRLGDATGPSITDTVQLDVSSYVKVDYSTNYNFNDNTTITFGINNLLDKQPPLTLRTTGSHGIGFDGRYHDIIGRTFYLSADYTF